MSKEAMKQALKAFEQGLGHLARDILLTAIAETEKQEQGEPVTLLPDGSAFGLMSFPLPDDHWIYAPNEYRDGEYEPIDLPKPILTHELRNEVVAAIRYAVRGATMRGQEKDFDPDALVQNAVYALCGPFTSAQPAKQEQGEPVAWMHKETALLRKEINKPKGADWDADHWIPLCAAPQQHAWATLIRGVRVEGETVVITVYGGNDAARELCGALIDEAIKTKK